MPREIRSRTKSPLRRSAARSTGGGAPSSRPQNFAQVERLAEPALALADQQHFFARSAKAKARRLGDIAKRPTPPIAGVGKMPLPCVSL